MVKKIRTLALVIAALAPLAVFAQSPTIGSVNLQTVFDGYYRTVEFNKNLQAEFKGIQEELAKLESDYEKLNEEHVELRESALSQAVSAAERQRRLEEADKKLKEVQSFERTFATRKNDAQKALATRQQEARSRLVDDIQLVVGKVAKSEDVDVVVDSVAASRNDAPIFLYINPEFDLTSSVLTELNKQAPKDFQAPVAE